MRAAGAWRSTVGGFGETPGKPAEEVSSLIRMATWAWEGGMRERQWELQAQGATSQRTLT